jgi:hypothetical protein
MTKIRDSVRHRLKLIKSYIGWEDYIALMLILIGAFGYLEGPIPFVPHLTDFGSNQGGLSCKEIYLV